MFAHKLPESSHMVSIHSAVSYLGEIPEHCKKLLMTEQNKGSLRPLQAVKRSQGAADEVTV